MASERISAPAIRPAVPADRDAIAALVAYAERLHARLAPGLFRSVRSAARPSVGDNMGNELWLVAERAGRVIGLVHAELHAATRQPWIAQAVRCQIHELVVLPRHRRRGIGRRLMEEATRWARHRGATQMLLTVWEGNRAAQSFYRDIGFRNVSAAMMCAL